MTPLDERLQAFREMPPIERALALCIFGLNLTVTARVVIWDGHPESVVLEQLKQFNESYQKIFGHAAKVIAGGSSDSDDMSFLKMFIFDPTSPGAVGKLARDWDKAIANARARRGRSR